MTERVDHAAEAWSILNDKWHSQDHAVTSLGMAQVHATLAVAEQLRVANLIAMGGLEITDRAHAWRAIREVAAVLGIGADDE